ncbi:MAG: YhjD/YihY/BrkB family envelope integrity protein [Mycobacteriales bacterium]
MTTAPRVPAWARSLFERYADTWPGRIVEDTLRALVRINVLDRAMTLAAQAFTSVFPLLILVAVLRPRRSGNQLGEGLADSLGLGPDASAALEVALPAGSTAASSFGVIGILVTLLSATSFSRALVRLYAGIWEVSRPPGLRALWRLVATLLGLVLLVFLLTFVRRVLQGVPLSAVAEAVVACLLGALIWTWVPWVLLAGRVPVRKLLPSGVLMGAAMVVLTIAGRIYLPRALSSATRQYGALGVSFTYVSWLFVLMLALVTTAVTGAVVARDRAGSAA